MHMYQFVVQLLLQVKMCVTKAKTGDGINRKSDYTYRKSILADWSRWSLCVRIDKKENKKQKKNNSNGENVKFTSEYI